MQPTSANDLSDRQKPSNIRRRDILRVFWRSFFMQSVWNYRSLISVGFGMCLIPILRRLYDDAPSRSAFLSRHFKFFNAHPYMASYALGVSIHLEEAFASGDPDACNKLERFKQRLISILGAMGDRLFWSTIKPASLTFGVTGLVLFDDLLVKFIWLIMAFLVYNTPHLYLRYRGIWEGYRQGIQVYKLLNEQRYNLLYRLYYGLAVASIISVSVGLIIQFIQINEAAFALFLLSATVATVVFKSSRNFYLSVCISFVMAVGAGALL